MALRYTLVFLCAFAVLAGCDESVRSKYATRAQAETEKLFERGWLPAIIPPSSRQIEVRNDLDLNTSEGDFKFHPSDHDDFIAHLKRIQVRDIEGYSAYSIQEWTFWISDSRDYCMVYHAPDSELIEQGVQNGVVRQHTYSTRDSPGLLRNHCGYAAEAG